MYHVRGSGLDDPEWRGVVDGEHGVPLLVRQFVQHAIPGEPSIVDDMIELAKGPKGWNDRDEISEEIGY